MKRSALLLLIGAWCAAAVADGQDLRVAHVQSAGSALTMPVGELSPTPSMWFYEKEWQRYTDPKLAVRRNAELRAEQRARRLETGRWFGYSPSRPPASHTPFTGYYSPMWVGNGGHPYHWLGVGQAPVVVVPQSVPMYR